MSENENIPAWIHVVMIISIVVVVAHLLTEFVVNIGDQNTRSIAYTTATVFTVGTIAYLISLIRTNFWWVFKIIVSVLFVVWIVIYVIHLYWLRHPSGWGWKTGFILFVYNCLLLIGYYCLLFYRNAIERFQNETGM